MTQAPCIMGVPLQNKIIWPFLMVIDFDEDLDSQCRPDITMLVDWALNTILLAWPPMHCLQYSVCPDQHLQTHFGLFEPVFLNKHTVLTELVTCSFCVWTCWADF